MNEIPINTSRLLLRQWIDSDLPSLTAMNQDPKVMEFIGPVIGEAESRTMIERARRSWASGERGINEVVSFCATLNHGSRRVMEKIGMNRDLIDDFLHPNLAPDDPLSPCALYRKEMPH